MSILKLPKCSAREYWTGYESDWECDANSDKIYSCEDCLCTYYTLGGLCNPVTGKKINPIKAFLLYGIRYRDSKNEL